MIDQLNRIKERNADLLRVISTLTEQMSELQYKQWRPQSDAYSDDEHDDQAHSKVAIQTVTRDEALATTVENATHQLFAINTKLDVCKQLKVALTVHFEDANQWLREELREPQYSRESDGINHDFISQLRDNAELLPAIAGICKGIIETQARRWGVAESDDESEMVIDLTPHLMGVPNENAFAAKFENILRNHHRTLASQLSENEQQVIGLADKLIAVSGQLCRHYEGIAARYREQQLKHRPLKGFPVATTAMTPTAVRTRATSSSTTQMIAQLQISHDANEHPFADQISHAAALRNRSNAFLKLCELAQQINAAPQFGYGSVSDDEKETLLPLITEKCADLLLLLNKAAVATCLATAITHDIDVLSSLLMRNKMSIESLSKLTSHLLHSSSANQISDDQYESSISAVVFMWAKILSGNPQLDIDQAEKFLASSAEFSAQMAALTEVSQTTADELPADSEEDLPSPRATVVSTTPSTPVPDANSSIAIPKATPVLVPPALPRTPIAATAHPPTHQSPLDAIRTGVSLRPVADRKLPAPKHSNNLCDLLSSTITAAINKRRGDMHIDNDRGHENDDDDFAETNTSASATSAVRSK